MISEKDIVNGLLVTLDTSKWGTWETQSWNFYAADNTTIPNNSLRYAVGEIVIEANGRFVVWWPHINCGAYFPAHCLNRYKP